MKILNYLISTLLILQITLSFATNKKVTNETKLTDQQEKNKENKSKSGSEILKGTMTDGVNGEPLPFANIVVFRQGVQIAGTVTDFDGKFTISSLTPGKYTIKATYIGYQPIQKNKVKITKGIISHVDIVAKPGVMLTTCIIIDYKEPLISACGYSCGYTTNECFTFCCGYSSYSEESIVKKELEYDSMLEKEISLDFYPNPTQGKLNVIIDELATQLFVFNMGGTLLREYNVANQDKVQLDLSNYAKGLYLLRMKVGDQMITGKVSVHH